jgi:hypothetical protein
MFVTLWIHRAATVGALIAKNHRGRLGDCRVTGETSIQACKCPSASDATRWQVTRLVVDADTPSHAVQAALGD